MASLSFLIFLTVTRNYDEIFPTKNLEIEARILHFLFINDLFPPILFPPKRMTIKKEHAERQRDKLVENVLTDGLKVEKVD